MRKLPNPRSSNKAVYVAPVVLTLTVASGGTARLWEGTERDRDKGEGQWQER
jgi:hypothetical protein